ELLIQKLQSSLHPVSSAQLAKQLQVTQRSIKNYVSAINADIPDLILSNHKGYSLNKKIKIHSPSHAVPQTYRERSFYIIKKFFLEHVNSIDIFELCDQFFLGYSSIKLLISKMNKDLAQFQLTFHVQNDHIYLKGAEKDRRKFLTNIVYQESAGGFANVNTLKTLFSNIDVEYIHVMLHDIFKYSDYYVNDFAYANISLHLVIALNQTMNNQILKVTNNEAPILDVCSKIIKNLEEHFQVHFSPQECQEINKLIYANLCLAKANNEQELILIVGTELYQTTIEIIQRINRHYGLHLNTDALLYPLALHLKNLFARYENQMHLKNPLLDSIQKTCPLLFECALYIAQYLNEEYNISISKDETAYLAMHIGADIDRQNSNNKKLQCVLLCPDYYDSQNEIYTYLLSHFDSQIAIISVCAQEDDIADDDFDLLFTTIETRHTYAQTILIPPFKNAIDIKAIFNQIQDKIDQKKLKTLSLNFSSFFHPDMFYFDTDGPKTRDDIIHRLYLLLKDRHCVNHYFYENVLRREKSATTAFDTVAIPHSMKMNANKTGIAVAISPSGIQWESQLVHLVFLIAINEKDSYIFKELYEALILLFSQKEIIHRICTCRTFHDFQKLLLSYVE
ncbi:MAG: PRD domain-containing protein, partial [Lachnospiraceae bacterium]|nr:PRD domain-containing protein [Lachnospiraceae bacterium]